MYLYEGFSYAAACRGRFRESRQFSPAGPATGVRIFSHDVAAMYLYRDLADT